MEQTEQFNTQQDPNYWPSVGMAALIFGLLTFMMQIISGYIQINAEPTGSIFQPSMFLGVVVCLVGAFGGMFAIWHYVREYGVNLTLGKGALIGFFTGAVMVFLGVVLNEIWSQVDPDFTRKVLDAMIANYEAMDIPEETKQQMIDAAAQQADPSIGQELFYGIPLYGILNLVTGMIGVSAFGRKKAGGSSPERAGNDISE